MAQFRGGISSTVALAAGIVVGMAGCNCGDACSSGGGGSVLLTPGSATESALETNRRVKSLAGRAWALQEFAEDLEAAGVGGEDAAWVDLRQSVRTFLYAKALAWSDGWDGVLAGGGMVVLPGSGPRAVSAGEFTRAFDLAAPDLSAEYGRLRKELAGAAAGR